MCRPTAEISGILKRDIHRHESVEILRNYTCLVASVDMFNVDLFRRVFKVRIYDLATLTNKGTSISKGDLKPLFKNNDSLIILCCYSVLVPFMTQISYASTAAELSNKKKYPRFFRTCASDVNQAEALAELVTYFNWRRVSTKLSMF